MTNSEQIPDAVPEHYTYVTKSLLRLHEHGVLTNVRSIDVEPEYGYVSRINYDNEEHRIVYGYDLGLNAGAPCDVAKDKGHTKFILRASGINCPAGKEFLLPWWAEVIGPSQQQRGHTDLSTVDSAARYIEDNLGFPAYVKPVSGSQGAGIHRVDNTDYLDEVFEEYDESRVRVAVVEEAINMPDYRIVCLDGELISAYRRVPFSVTGNGVDTIKSLMLAKQQYYEEDGRDTILDLEDKRIGQYLESKGYALDYIPRQEDEVALLPISNLSAGGTSEDVTDKIHDKWVSLATGIVKNFNLRLGGVDFACEDITDPDVEYSVLELNSTPGLDNYAASGSAQKEIVDKLYTRVFNALPSHG